MKKILSILIVLALAIGLIGCGGSGDEITVVSREDGSGTRGAFIELMGILEKDADGNKKDLTTEDAVIANKTDVMLATIAGDESSIGYVSLGSLNDNVKALSVDGVEASSENINNGSYKVARAFNIATKGDRSKLVEDFITFMLSAEGQALANENYISVNNDAEGYTASNLEGKLVVAGSSSVSPLMEKFAEAYSSFNPNVVIEVQANDSTAGMNGAIEGTCDIGMASRDLKESELEHLEGVSIAMDGIAIIVNNNNPIDNLSTEQVKEIFTGEIISWDQL
jgi:phosphate transport system substrate-binding protein